MIGGIGVSPGSGVARTEAYTPKLLDNPIITPDTGMIEEEDGKKILDRTGTVVEVNRPIIKGLFQQGQWRPGPTQVAVWHLANQEDLDAYNALMERAAGDDPEVVITQATEKFHNGNFVVLVKYFEVWYKSPINKK